MKIKKTKILILGGAGLIGRVIARRLLGEKPKALILHSLNLREASETVKNLRREFPKTRIKADSGDIFAFAESSEREKLKSKLSTQNRDNSMAYLEPLSNDILERSRLYSLLLKHQPEIIIDSINTATALAYRDRSDQTLLGSLEIPKLVRHLQVLHAAVCKNPEKKKFKKGAALYLKIGTTGTGGMGFNIPFTHGEEKPSRMLLSKSALAGAQTQLLYLLSQTPNCPKIIEIKPAAAVAWGTVAHGEIAKNGISRQNEDYAKIGALKSGRKLLLQGKRVLGNSKSVFVDSGENGLFSPEEFRALTQPSQMGLVCPEEVAEVVLKEIQGIETGHDVVGSLERAVVGPSKKAQKAKGGVFKILRKLSQTGFESPALGYLGPPRLSKLLFEGSAIKKIFGSFGNFASVEVRQGAKMLERFLLEDNQTRSAALTAGIPILLKDGRGFLSGSTVKIPVEAETARVNSRNIDDWADKGWIDLRPSNLLLWQKRVKRFRIRFKRHPRYPGEMAAEILKSEDKGYRKKSSSS